MIAHVWTLSHDDTLPIRVSPIRLSLSLGFRSALGPIVESCTSSPQTALAPLDCVTMGIALRGPACFQVEGSVALVWNSISSRREGNGSGCLMRLVLLEVEPEVNSSSGGGFMTACFGSMVLIAVP